MKQFFWGSTTGAKIWFALFYLVVIIPFLFTLFYGLANGNDTWIAGGGTGFTAPIFLIPAVFLGMKGYSITKRVAVTFIFVVATFFVLSVTSFFDLASALGGGMSTIEFLIYGAIFLVFIALNLYFMGRYNESQNKLSLKPLLVWSAVVAIAVGVAGYFCFSVV